MQKNEEPASKVRFNKSKAFSDFVGFHVRALFCVTLVLISFLPMLDDLFSALLWRDNSRFNRGSIEYLVGLGSACFFFMLTAVLYTKILVSIWDYLLSRLEKFWLAVCFVAAVLFEICAFIAISYVVFLRIFAVLIFTNEEQAELSYRWCLLDELWANNVSDIQLSDECLTILNIKRLEVADGEINK